MLSGEVKNLAVNFIEISGLIEIWTQKLKYPEWEVLEGRNPESEETIPPPE